MSMDIDILYFPESILTSKEGSETMRDLRRVRREIFLSTREKRQVPIFGWIGGIVQTRAVQKARGA